MKWTIFILILMMSTKVFLHASSNKLPPSGQKPLEIEVSVRINKIYNINTVDETFQLDGYLNYSWKDERMRFEPTDSLASSLIYENAQVDELIESTLWFPAIEFINVQGSQDIPNKQLIIDPDGTIYYSERFFGVFNAKMNFRKFPFDYQIYPLNIETFSYDINKVVFSNPKFYVNENYIGDDWEFEKEHTMVVSKKYEYLTEKFPNEDTYSRAIFEVHLNRNPGYYLWQVLFPLMIIILASFVIFWIHDFGTQIGVGFTLMLTVVAFNFYSVSLLPKLPYNTFIENVIIIGYIFIFLAILATIVNYRMNDVVKVKNKDRLLRHYRYVFPLGYILSMIVLYMFIFGD